MQLIICRRFVIGNAKKAKIIGFGSTIETNDKLNLRYPCDLFEAYVQVNTA